MAQVSILLEYGADVNQSRSIDGATPLLIASQNGHSQVVEILTAQGAFVDLPMAPGFTAVMVVSESTYSPIFACIGLYLRGALIHISRLIYVSVYA